MELTFRSNHLLRCAEDFDAAARAWGPAVAAVYHRHIGILLAAGSFEGLFRYRVLRLHPLRGRRRGEYAMELAGRWRLIITREGDATIVIEEVSNHYDD